MSDLLDGRYELGEPLGSGGTGAVRRARDRVLDRDVAVKLLHPGAVGDDRHRSRLREEARLAGALQHHGIARVFDYGEDRAAVPPTPYVVMELVEGRSLAAVLRERRTLRPEEVRDLVAQVAAALAVAHAAGIVHRDLKPGNVVLTGTGRAVLVDFGIARSTGGEPLTATGTVVGTVDYLSPERAAGGSAGPQADLYALGVLAYECLTGVRPFRRDSAVATALAQVQDTAPPLPVEVPQELARLVERLMAKDPADRPSAAVVVTALSGAPPAGFPIPVAGAVAGEVAGAVAGAREPRTETLAVGRPATTRRTSRRTAVLAAAGALVVGVGAALVADRMSEPVPAATEAAETSRVPAAGATTAVADRGLRVPEGLVGLPYDEAADRVRAVGLHPVRQTWAAGAADPALRGLVADVQPGPAAGRLAPGSDVVLVVAVGAGRPTQGQGDAEPVDSLPDGPASAEGGPGRSAQGPGKAKGKPPKAKGGPGKGGPASGKPGKGGPGGGGPGGGGPGGGGPGKGKGGPGR